MKRSCLDHGLEALLALMIIVILVGLGLELHDRKGELDELWFWLLMSGES